jgi:hypothetical protein
MRAADTAMLGTVDGASPGFLTVRVGETDQAAMT